MGYYYVLFISYIEWFGVDKVVVVDYCEIVQDLYLVIYKQSNLIYVVTI